MPKTLIRFALTLLAGLVVAGCGQKGPLFLPGDPSAIYSAPPQQAAQPADDVDDDDDEDAPGTIQNQP